MNYPILLNEKINSFFNLYLIGIGIDKKESLVTNHTQSKTSDVSQFISQKTKYAVRKLKGIANEHMSQKTRNIVFTVAVIASFVLAPKLFLAGVAIGFAAAKFLPDGVPKNIVQYQLIAEQNKVVDKIVNGLHAVFAGMGATGTILATTGVSQSLLVKASPLLAGATAGVVLFNAYKTGVFAHALSNRTH